MIIIIADVDEVAALLDMDEARQPEIVRPQTSGPCVHYGPYGCEVPREDGQCPHLDNTCILCPVKDTCYAMHEVARMREAEQEEQDQAIVAESAAVPEPEITPKGGRAYEAPPPTHGGWPSARGWTPTEEQIMHDARTPTEAVSLYRAAYPDPRRPEPSFKGRHPTKIRVAPRPAAPPAPVAGGAAEELADADVCAPDGGTIDDTTCDRPHRSLVGQQVRLLGPHDLAGSEGTIRNVCADQVLVALNDAPDRVWVSKQDALSLSVEEAREGSR